jgi:hypothetical protein
VSVRSAVPLVLLVLLALPTATPAESKRVLWGDTHVHSRLSFDAYLNLNMSADPATAYRFAKGLPVIHPFNRARVQIGTPLDFLVVADHAETLGLMSTIVEAGIPREGLGLADRARAWLIERRFRKVVEDDEGMSAFTSFLPETRDVETAAAAGRTLDIPNAGVISSWAWKEIIETADAYDEPGVFTALIGWEWSSIPAGANLHRVVFTSADASLAAQFRPYSSLDSMYPEDLWAWLRETSERTGAEFVAIPHNSNISRGYMFGETSLRGEPMSPEYARLRRAMEPVVEVTQLKGDSEAHPELSPEDPFADFEEYPHYIHQNAPDYRVQAGDYVRSGLLRGLAIEEKIGFNPYRFGLIGSTDAHTGLASAEEPNFWGKFGRDSIPEGKNPTWRSSAGPNGWSMSASGLAAVWAEENTRDAILAAFRRREVYATTGPRIHVRVFGGFDYTEADLEADDLASLAARGVPMGGELTGRGGAAPRFWVRAAMDPVGAHLDRVQIVKGWLDAEGRTHEKVHDVAWSDDRELRPDRTLPPVGSTIDPGTGAWTNEIGSPELATVWQDPDFEPLEPAFYYVRVLAIPTPRHSLLDALALGIDPGETGKPVSIQERAYTSPIWYVP